MQILSQTTWPALSLESWRDTRATLRIWTQIIGKVWLTPAPKLEIDVAIWAVPVEGPDPIPFAKDTVHASSVGPVQDH